MQINKDFGDAHFYNFHWTQLLHSQWIQRHRPTTCTVLLLDFLTDLGIVLILIPKKLGWVSLAIGNHQREAVLLNWGLSYQRHIREVISANKWGFWGHSHLQLSQSSKTAISMDWIHKKAKAHRSVTMISLGGSKLDHVLIFLKATFPLLNDEMNECFYGYCHHYFLNVCVSQPKYGL